MKLPDEKIQSVKEWLLLIITPELTQSEPDMLSNYIITLLKKDMSLDAHRSGLIQNLQIFVSPPNEFVDRILKEAFPLKRVRSEKPENPISTKPVPEPYETEESLQPLPKRQKISHEEEQEFRREILPEIPPSRIGRSIPVAISSSPTTFSHQPPQPYQDEYNSIKLTSSAPRNMNTSQRRGNMNNSQRQRRVIMETSAIVVFNVPRDEMTQNNVRQEFGSFGEIQNILLDVRSNKVFVTFNDKDAAKRAVRSKEPFFNNRFVRVKYYSKKKPRPKRDPTKKKPKVKKFVSVSEVQVTKQRIAQMNNLLTKYKELAKRIASLPKNCDPNLRKSLVQTSANIMKTIRGLQKEQREKLEQNQQILAKQKKVPKTFALDNRPTSLLVKDWPKEELMKNKIQQHFKFYGYIVSIVIDHENATCVVKYNKRGSAEKAKKFASRYGGLVLKLEWYHEQQKKDVEEEKEKDVEEEKEKDVEEEEEEEEEVEKIVVEENKEEEEIDWKKKTEEDE